MAARAQRLLNSNQRDLSHNYTSIFTGWKNRHHNCIVHFTLANTRKCTIDRGILCHLIPPFFPAGAKSVEANLRAINRDGQQWKYVGCGFDHQFRVVASVVYELFPSYLNIWMLSSNILSHSNLALSQSLLKPRTNAPTIQIQYKGGCQILLCGFCP